MDEITKRELKCQRDAAICAYYLEGRKLAECASKFQLGRQRVLQILKIAGVWKPYEKTNRTKFLGVTVTPETKAALEEKADDMGISVSKLASDALDSIVSNDEDEVVK